MDFLDPKRQRSQSRRLVAGYFLMAIALTLATLILVFQALGYDLNRSTGSIIQNGLVFVSAQPESASIYLNNQLQKNRTDTRLTLPSGQYTLRLERTGYLPWQRTIGLTGGNVERLDYPFLFPSKLSTTDVQLYASAPVFATQSPDRHWLLVQEPGQSLANFEEYDTNNPQQAPIKFALPSAILTASSGAQSWTAVEWSTDNRHVLLKHSYDNTFEFIMVDRDTPANSFNVNKTFKQNPDEVALHDKRFDSLWLYVAAGKTLALGNVKDGTVSNQLNGIRAFKPYGNNMILYATDEAAPAGKTLIRLREDTTSYTLRQVTNQGPYLLDLARFNGSWYIAAGAASEGRTYIFKDPLSSLKQTPPQTLGPISILKLDDPTQVSFSANTRFIMIQSGKKFAVYDADDDLRFAYQLKFDVTDTAKWMDGARLILTQSGKTLVLDFDGTNQHLLSPTTLPGGGYFDRDYKRLFSLAPSVVVPNRTALTQTDLKAKP